MHCRMSTKILLALASPHFILREFTFTNSYSLAASAQLPSYLAAAFTGSQIEEECTFAKSNAPDDSLPSDLFMSFVPVGKIAT